MSDFVHRHEMLFVFLIIALTIACVLHYERWQDRRALRMPHSQRESARIWQCASFFGGANVYTPVPMTRAQAITFATALGSIAYVDDDHGKIFYKVRS